MNITSKITSRGSELSTKEYRKLSNISYSDIKLFLSDRKSFYKKKILGEHVTEKDSLSKTIGDLVHCKLLEPQNWEKLFCVAAVNVSGQMGDLAKNLYNRTVKCMNEEGEVTLSFPILMDQAVNDTRYNGKGEEVAFKKKTFEWIVDQFNGSDAEILYKTMRSNFGKTTIMPHNDEHTEHIANEMKQNPSVNEWLNECGDKEIHNELPVTFTHEGVEVKILLDIIAINHNEKYIQPCDVKTTWDEENFKRNYLSKCYYIQSCLYNLGAMAWANQQGIGDYEVRPFKFLVADSQGYMKSSCYTLTEKDLQMAYSGFYINDEYYPGLKETLADIGWSIDTGIWNQTRRAALCNGNMGLELMYM